MNGVGHVAVDAWSWGGSFVLEFMVKHKTLTADSAVFHFKSADGAGGLALRSDGETAAATVVVHHEAREAVHAEVAGMFEPGGGWVHAVLTADALRGLRLYKDGRLVASRKAPVAVPQATRMLELGSKPAKGGASLNGTLAFFRVWHGEAGDAWGLDRAKLLFLRRHARATPGHHEATTRAADSLSPSSLDVPAAAPLVAALVAPPSNRRVLVVLHGESARWRDSQQAGRCNEQGVAHQNATTATQRKRLFQYLEVKRSQPCADTQRPPNALQC